MRVARRYFGLAIDTSNGNWNAIVAMETAMSGECRGDGRTPSRARAILGDKVDDMDRVFATGVWWVRKDGPLRCFAKPPAWRAGRGRRNPAGIASECVLR